MKKDIMLLLQTVLIVTVISHSGLSSMSAYDNSQTSELFDVEELRVAKLDQVDQLDMTTSTAVAQLQKSLGQTNRHGLQSVLNSVRLSAQSL